MPTPFEIIGEDGFTRLVRAFYAQVPTDDILGPMYPAHDLEGAETHLRLFLMFRFGGPETYVELRGHPRLRLRHAPFHLDRHAADRWLTLMDRALKQTGLPAAVDAELRAFFGDTARFLINTEPVPVEPLVTLEFIEVATNTRVGEATVVRRQVAGGFEPGTKFGLSGQPFVLVRAEPLPGGDNERVRMYVQRQQPEAL